MANTLMFEVGIKSAQEQLEKIKQEFTKANGELSKLLNIKVSIDGLDAVTKALSQIGDTSALRNLRTEIAALNREFSILSKGAGGSGDMVSRGLSADIEKTTQSIDRYTNKIKELTEQRSRLVGGTRNSNYQSLTDDIMRWTSSLEGAKKKLAELNEQKNKPVASESLKKSTQDAQAFETALGRIETAIGGLKSGMSVNLTGDFSKWAQEVQNVTASVRELVGQLQAMNLTREQGEAKSSTQAQTKQIEEQIQSVLKETEAYRQLARMREEAASYERRSGYRSGTMGFTSTDHFFGAIDSFIRYGRESHGYDNGSYFEDIQRRIQSTTMTAKELASEMDTFKQKFSSIPGVDEQKRYDRILNEYKVVLDAMERVKKEEDKIRSGASQPAPQGGLFDPQKFTTLQEAIDKIIAEINRLQQAFTRLGENSSLSNLSTQINGLAVTLSSLSNAVKFTGSADEIAAYEAKVKSLKDTIAQLEAQAKQVAESVVNATKGISTQAEKKGSESVLADNLQKLKSRIADVRAEFNRLNESYGQAKTMGMPVNMDIEQRLDVLRRYIQAMQQLEDAAKKTTNATKAEQEIREALSKSKAFSFIQFDGNQLFSKENTRIFNKKEIDAYIKSIEQFVKTRGKFAESSGPATNSQEKLNETLSRTSIAARNASESFSSTAAGMSNFAKNVETARLAYDKTLRGISELESRISAGQKANMDKESLDFMNGLKQRAQQWADILKKILGDDMRGNPAYKAFLSQSSNILTSPQMGNMFTSLLGSDWKILMKDIGETFNMLMKFSGFSKSLTLDNSTLANWLKGEEAVRRLDNALKDLNRQWAATNSEAKTPDLSARYEAQKRAIESLIAQIRGAMTEADRMSNRNGLSDLLGVGFKNAVGYDNTRLIQEMRTRSGIVEREEKEITRQIEREDKERQRIYERSEKERQALIEQTAKRIKDIEASIARGNASGRDMSALESALSKMKGQSSLLSKTMPDDPAFKKRMQDLKVLVEDTERLRKAEDKLTAAQERNNKAKIKSDNKALQEEAKSVNDAWIKYDELSAKIKELESLRDRGIKANIDVSQIDNAIAKYQDLIRVMGEIINNAGRTSKGNLTSELFGAAPVKKMILDAKTEVNSYTKSLAEAEKRMNNAATAAGNLDRKIQDIEARRVDFSGMDTSRLDAGLTRLRGIRNELENFSKTGFSLLGNNAGEIAKKMGLAAANKEVKDSLSQLSGQLRQNERDARNATNAVNQLSDAEQRLAHAIKGSSDAMKNQTNILSDLKTMATQYLGVWGAQQFVQNIIQIGGQLEQQRLSIGAILGDMAAGQHLFDQIKQLALTSPFGVVELDKDTKQLSAYGFKQSELFDMTKRLADISAGAGTEVSRLALALGHVRSEGALTGYTLRQFAMNNIPMLQKLSERLTKIEGQIVSTSEIRKRVSKKEIGYEDVIAVIKDLTNEGGIFFNMQETMAEAVNAKFKNLKDSMDIMYGEMAEGGIGSALKKVAESLMFLTRNWEETARVVGYGTTAFVLYRVAVSAANTQMLTYGSTLGATTKTLNAKAIALGVNTAAVKRLTADEIDEMVTLKLVTREQLLNAVATKKLTVDQAELAAATFGVTRAELTSIATKGKLGVASAGLGLRLRSLALSIRGVGVALKSMLLNPVGIALMAITAGFEVFMRWKQRNEEIAQSIDQLGKKGSEGYKNLAATMEKYSDKDGKMSESEYSTAISDIIDQLKNYAPNIHNIQEEAQSIDSLAERYKYLRDELESTKNAYADLERTKSFASNANEATGNMLNDTFTENVEEYISNVQKVDKAEQELMQHRIVLEKTLDELEKKTAFKRRTDENGNVMSLVEQLKYIRSTDWNKVFSPMLYSNSQGASAALSAYSSALTQMEERMRNEVMPDLQNFASRLNNQYAGIFGKDWKENADHIKTAWMAVVSEIDKIPGMTDNVKRELLEKIFNETWHMNIDFSTGEVTESLTGWRKEMQDWLDEHGLKFNIGFNDSREDIYKKAKAAQEAAQTEMNNAGQVLIGIGFKLNNLPNELPSPLATPWNQKNLEDYNEQKNVNDLWEQFQKHFGANWQTKQDKSNNKKSKSEDKDARRLREIIKLYKDAYEWYTKYEKQVGEGSALKKVQEQFKPLFDQFKDQFKQELSLDSIPLYKENLESLLDEAEKLYKNPKHKNSYMVEAIKQIRDAINNVGFEELGRKQEDFLSKTQLQLDNLTRSWETFNAVREATGNVRLAVELSGADYVNGETQNLADSIKKKIQRDFAQAGSVGIPFDINLSDRKIKEKIEEVMPAASEDHLKGLIEEYKKWRDLQRDVLKRDINTFAKLVGSAKDYDSQLKRINDELEKQIEANERLVEQGVISQKDADKANEIALFEARDKAWKASVGYSQLFNNSLALTRQEIENGINLAMDMLNEKMRLGLMTAQEYADEMAKIRDIQSEWTKNSALGGDSRFWAGAKGGLQGISQYNQRNLNRINTEIAEIERKARSGQSYDGARLYELKEKKERGDNYGKYIDSLGGVFDKFDALSKALDPVISLFDKLGMSVVGEALGIGKNALNQASAFGSAAESVISGAGPYGAAIGAGLSIASGLFGMFDAALQEEIDASKARQQEMENLTKNLEKALERTLGGVYRTENSSEDRRKLQEYRERYMTQELVVSSLSKHFAGQELSKEAKAFYAEVDKAFSKAQQTNSYYDTQRAFLYAQRYELQKQLSAEKDKKNSDDNAIADYKQQLAELEDQIKYFALDMAKALYDIDIQSWASDLTDAIVDAWENGEDAAEAYANKVKDLMKDLTKNILTKKVMEKAFENAGIDKLIADMMDVTSGKLDYTMVPELAKALAQAGQDSTDIITRVLDELERMGYIEKGEGSASGSVTSGIKSITENTADLLASYLNAIRADVSVNRAMIAQYFPLYYTALTSSNQSLRGIENNTAAIMRSNEVVAEKITSLDDNINGLRNSTWRVPVS